MRFTALDECSDSELHCIYHDPERTITVLHPRTACSLHIYAPEEDTQVTFGIVHTRRSNNVHPWWLQHLSVARSQLLGIGRSVVRKTVATVQHAVHYGPPHEETVREHLKRNCSVIPHYDALDEEEFIRDIQPLPSPWSWPPNAYYREARRGYTAKLTEPLIADLITQGLLLANEVGIRWKHMDQYILLRTEKPPYRDVDQSRIERLDTPAFRRAALRRFCVDEGSYRVDEGPGTPIVEIDDPMPNVGVKKVRLSAKSSCLVLRGEEQTQRIEDVKDNEGKTATSKYGFQRRRKSRTRLRICWDSDRGF